MSFWKQKKHKRRDGASKRPYPPYENVSTFYVDHNIKKIVVVTKDVVINQLRRDSPKIAASFDSLTDTDLREISQLFADAMGILMPQIIGRDLTDEARGPTCARLLNTAMTTCLACIELARSGYRRESMMLIRNVVEAIATVLHIVTIPQAIGNFHSRKLKSTDSISVAQKCVACVWTLIWDAQQ